MDAVNQVAEQMLDLLNDMSPHPKDALLALTYLLVDLTITFTSGNEDDLVGIVRAVYADRITNREIH